MVIGLLEAAIMRKFQPYYKFNPWRFVESRIFRKMFRGLCEHRLDTNMINYPGRLYMASLECPECKPRIPNIPILL